MSWIYDEPRREDYATEEDYRRAMDAYDAALDAYIDDYIDSRRDEG